MKMDLVERIWGIIEKRTAERVDNKSYLKQVVPVGRVNNIVQAFETRTGGLPVIQIEIFNHEIAGESENGKKPDVL